MFGRSQADRELAASIDRRSERMEVLLERLDAALIVREPGTARAAEAYDGLRKTVAAAAADRRRLSVVLVDLHDRLDGGISVEDLKSVVDEWVMTHGLVRDGVGNYPEAFDIVEGAGHGTELEVIQPAWVDSNAGVVVKRGQGRLVVGSHVNSDAVAAEPTVDDTAPGTDAADEADPPPVGEVADVDSQPDPQDAAVVEAASIDEAPDSTSASESSAAGSEEDK
jgi:hypothetical protein